MDDDAFLRTVKAPETPEELNIAGIPAHQMTDEQYHKAVSPIIDESMEKSVVTAKPQTTPARYSNPWSAGLQSIYDNGVSGEIPIIRGHAGMDLYRRDDLSIEQELQIAKNAIPEDLKQRKLSLDTYTKEQAFEVFGFNVNPINVIGLGAKQLPNMREMIFSSAKGAAIGAPVGALGGGGLGALSGSAFGPQGTAAGGTMGAVEGAITGAVWGGKAAQFETASTMAAGNFYLDSIERGADKATARKTAAAVGVVSGLLETMEMKFYSDAAKSTAKTFFSSPKGKEILKQMVVTHFKTMGKEVTVEELQEITEYSGEMMNAVLDNNEVLRPGNILTDRGDEASLVSRLIDTGFESAAASLVIGGGSQAAGAGAGATAKRVKANLTGKTAKDIITAVSEGARNVKPTEAEVQETEAQAPEQILDELAEEVGSLTPEVVEEVAEQIGIEPDALFQLKEVFTSIQPEAEAFREQNIQETTTEMEVQDAEGASVVTEVADPEAEAQTIGTIESTETAPETVTVELPPEMKARKKQIDKETKDVDKRIEQLEKEFTEKDNANMEAAELKEKISDLSNQQKANAAQIAELNKEIKKKEKAGKSTTNIWKTLDKIGVMQESVVNQLEQAKERLTELDTGATTWTMAQLDKMYDLRGTLDTERSLIEEGLLTPEEIKNAKVTMSVGQLAAARARAAQRVLAAFKQGMKDGISFTKADIKQVQNQLVSLIRDSGMSKKDQAKFLETVKNTQTPEQLLKALPKIETRIADLVEKENIRVAETKLQKVLKRAGLKKNGKYAEGKYTAEVQDLLNEYTEIAEAGYDNLADIEELISVIEDLIGEGKSKRQEKMAQEAAEYEALETSVMESLNGTKPFSEKEKTDGVKNALRRVKRQFGKTLETWRGLMELVSQHDQTHKMKEIFDSAKPREAYFRIMKTWEKRSSDHIREALKKAGSRIKSARALERKLQKDNANPPSGQGEFQDAEGNPQVLYKSIAGVRDLWMKMQAAKHDPVIRQSLEDGNKYTFRDSESIKPGDMSTEELVESILTPDDIAIAEAQFELYDMLYAEVLNPYWRERYGVNLPKAKMYSPITRENFDLTDSETLLHDFKATGGMKPSSTIKRTGSTDAIKTDNDILVFSRHVERILRYVTYDKFDRTSKRVFGSGKVRVLIQNKYGEAVYQLIMNHRRDLNAGRAAFNDIAWQAFGSLRQKTATAMIGGKLGAIPKQATAMLTSLVEVGPIRFAKSAATFHLRPLKTRKILDQSATFRQIVRANNRDIAEVLNAQQMGSPQGKSKVLNAMLWPVQRGVEWGAGVAGMSIYDHHIEKGATPEQAVHEMNRHLTDTQQSGFMDEQSAKERSGHLGKIATMFSGDPLQASRQMMRAFRGVFSRPTNHQEYVRLLRTIAVFHIAIPVSFQYMANMLSDRDDEHDEDRLWRAAILGAPGSIAGLGDVLTMAYTAVTNELLDDDERVYEPSSPLFSVAAAIGTFAGKSAEFLMEEDEESLYKALYALAKASPVLPKWASGGFVWPEVANWFVPKPLEKKKTPDSI